MTIETRVVRDVHREVERFLYQEAKLLDDNLYRDWFSLFTEDMTYQIPVRVTKERAAGRGFSKKAFHMDETFGSMEVRIDRLETEYAWAEDPPSRTRHFVSNIMTDAVEAENEIAVTSNLLVYRGRYDSPSFHLISCERHDVLRETDGSWKIARRLVLLDHTTLGTHNLAIFL